MQWEHAVISLQSLMRYPVMVGGRTALHMHGFRHQLPPGGLREAHLYGSAKPPGWLFNLPCKTEFAFHNDKGLFPDTQADVEPLVEMGLSDLNEESKGIMTRPEGDFHSVNFTRSLWGMRRWPIVLSTKERAMLEAIDELPNRQIFGEVDVLIKGVVIINRDRMNALLKECASMKVKKLLVEFAERHNHDWLKYIDIDTVEMAGHERQILGNGC